jgi:uncharacterized phage protein (TIGR01671 family)
MNREIEFRGKRISNGEWVYGYYIRYVNTEKDIIVIDKLNRAPECVTVIPETVGQFTGLLDMNGKEIYEGDIVTIDCYPFYDDAELNYVAIVEWMDDGYGFGYIMRKASNEIKGISDRICESFEGCEDGEFEIVGNIYEHKHLLK